MCGCVSVCSALARFSRRYQQLGHRGSATEGPGDGRQDPGEKEGRGKHPNRFCKGVILMDRGVQAGTGGTEGRW